MERPEKNFFVKESASTSIGVSNEKVTVKQCSFSRPGLLLEHSLLFFSTPPDLVHYPSTVYLLVVEIRYYV